jgi:transaldolase
MVPAARLMSIKGVGRVRDDPLSGSPLRTQDGNCDRVFVNVQTEVRNVVDGRSSSVVAPRVVHPHVIDESSALSIVTSAIRTSLVP